VILSLAPVASAPASKHFSTFFRKTAKRFLVIARTTKIPDE